MLQSHPETKASGVSAIVQGIGLIGMTEIGSAIKSK